MADLRKLMQDILANGKVESAELELLRHALGTNGPIDRREADFLVELHKRAERVTPGFEEFFYQTIKRHLLANGSLGAKETAWLRQMVLADRTITDQEKKFLRQLRGEAQGVSPEFEALCAECLKA